MSTTCPIVEYRRYTLHPGMRDTLITLFERAFVETQEEQGMTLLGQFRVRDKPDLFVWLRGFPDMATRGERLGAFYGGPAWKANRDAANTTMIDSDDVFLLRPAAPQSGFTHDTTRRAPRGSSAPRHGLFLGVTWFVSDAAEFAATFAATIEPVLAAAGGCLRASFVTAYEENDFPALPVRAETVFVCFVEFEPATSTANVDTALAPHCDTRTELLWLTPTERSALYFSGA